LHPSATADALVANLAYQDAFDSPVVTPEPPTITRFALGGAGLLMLWRSKRRAIQAETSTA